MRSLAYDVLVVATGASLLPEETEGLTGPGWGPLPHGCEGSGRGRRHEADDLDPATRTGWSVVVTGAAGPVTDPGELARYLTHLTPWADTEMEQVVRIRADIVTGYRLVGGEAGS
ncbi:Pyridoxamine 5'-phosphate oxidase [Streptomyces sp. 3213]|uniref:pyridoxamine 5'-phosphate oxidase family protein n=1 Tax=Streptomyces sp. 3213.3 TaxID=1855348 RepID=UPI0008963397|nr:pyridoxamine 5'-phosphate oxidase family protein [Streptomyces sp. 3213.3]SEC29837.1 Pyridoxamine 5'-phosphate oxidase [Streptomyces sp. 3213] [Streptomyces sp. 3213.3]